MNHERMGRFCNRVRNGGGGFVWIFYRVVFLYCVYRMVEGTLGMWYIVTFIAGAMFGALMICLCVVAADADRRTK